jgi:hypothetical protein
MRQIRRSVFETNSSSTHSISIISKDNYRDGNSFFGDTLDGCFGEFGWGYEKLNTVYERLSYVLTMIQYKVDNCDNLDDVINSTYYKWISEMIKDYTGADLKLEEFDDDCYSLGYIDHQSTDILDDFWSDNESEFKNNMRDIIFNDKYRIIIDNDNH